MRFLDKFFKKDKTIIKYLTKATLTETNEPEVMLLKGRELGTGVCLIAKVRYAVDSLCDYSYISVGKPTKFILVTKDLTIILEGRHDEI